MNIDDEDKQEFPSEFTLNFNSFSKDFNTKFVKIERNHPSHPLSSKPNIYVIDESTGKPKLYEENDQDQANHELYGQKDNSKGFATLIKNERKDQNDNHFRMVRLNCLNLKLLKLSL